MVGVSVSFPEDGFLAVNRTFFPNQLSMEYLFFYSHDKKFNKSTRHDIEVSRSGVYVVCVHCMRINDGLQGRLTEQYPGNRFMAPLLAGILYTI